MRTVKFSTFEIQKAERLAPEIEEGNREYKFKLTDLSDDQLTHRITQLNWRLNEGNDEAFYLIGVEDNGNQLGLNDADLQESLRNLQFIADQVGCEMTVRQLYAGVQGTTAEVHMRRRQRITVDVVHVNVAVAGDLNSGKSTMIGVLSTGRLDNGKGLARMQVLTHNHEVESGTTSCISHHSLHFGKDGEVSLQILCLFDTSTLTSDPSFLFLQVLNSDPLPGMGKGNRLRTLSDLELADETSRSVTLIDLAGHSKYLKTTLHGLIGRRPDHCIVCVSATTGLNNITAEHLGVCMYLNVPLVIVITKEDCVGRGTVIKPKAKAKAAAKARNAYATQEEVSEEVLTTAPSTTDAISRLVAGVRDVLTGSQHESTLITTDGELVQHLMREADAARPTVPIFTVSNVTGSGLQLLRSYLFQLPGHAKQRASAAESACVRILGSIGNADERDEVVFPRDEEQFVLNKKPVRERRYVNRDNADLGSGKYNTECNSEVGICLMAPSTSDDNIAARDVKLAPSTPCSNIRKSYSSPDLPATTASAAGQSGGKNIKISGTPDEKSTTREFSEYVEAGASPGPESTSCRDSPSSQVSSGTGAGSRTKVLIGSIEAGKISVGQGLLLGPTCRGEFLSVSMSYASSVVRYCAHI